MGFIPISINNYIKKHLKNNPEENEKDLRKRINEVLTDYKKGVKCTCGNDIWVIGSASVGNSCFSCITGESYPIDDYEIDSAIIKRESIKDGEFVCKSAGHIVIAEEESMQINSEFEFWMLETIIKEYPNQT